LLAIKGELKRDPALAAIRVPLEGEPEPDFTLWDLVQREGRRRTATAEAPGDTVARNREPEPDEEP